tara:strand:- start:2196 stop:3515 length:1320 start_codon:yes stop_codon:yes gene_type:complete
MIRLEVQHDFHPVGQGLFASGLVHLSRVGGSIVANAVPLGPDDPTYRWVYDCGTCSKQALVTREIARLKREFGDSRIDLLTLSHFDHDHVSGVVRLLNALPARIVMLPYAPLWERLLIGFDQGFVAGDEALGFFVNPVAYLAQAAPERFDEVLFVPRSNGEGRPPFLEPGDLPVDSGEPGELRGKPEYGPDRGDPEFDEEMEGLSGPSSGIRVNSLRRGGSISLYGYWEFVPYNDPTLAPLDRHAFAASVAPLRDKLVDGSESERTAALALLRDTYDEEFTRPKRNDTSLFLYGGPSEQFENFAGGGFRLPAKLANWPLPRRSGYFPQSPKILMTGDGVLKEEDQFDRLRSSLGPWRLEGLGTLQVMHHGAKSCWHEGLAGKFRPATSVISSNPSDGRTRHPSPEVLRDFWPYEPVQVDQHIGLRLWFRGVSPMLGHGR